MTHPSTQRTRNRQPKRISVDDILREAYRKFTRDKLTRKALNNFRRSTAAK